MKNTINRIFLALLFIGIYSCDKEGQIETNQEANDDTEIFKDFASKYYLDDSEITQENYESITKNEDILTHSHFADDTNGKSYVQQRAYTSSDLYYSWGDQLDLKLREADAYAKEMAEFAETSGTIKAYEETGKIPTSFTSFSDKKYLSYFGEESNEAKRALSVSLYKNETQFMVMFKTLAIFPRSYRKRVKYVKFNGFNGNMTIYRKTFYRRRVARITGKPSDGKIYLYGAANRNKSAFKIY